MRPSDAYFDLIAETLEGMDSGARAQFLHRLFLTVAHVEIPENQASQLWDDIQARRKFLSEKTDSQIALHTAMVDVLSSGDFIRVPVVLEYEELKNLHRTAVTDPLTSLQNRRLFDETFEKELNRARRYGQPLSLVMLDLNRFKEVNDKHGHPRGDEVLRAAASTLKKALRVSDSAFRIGGDEFALLLPQTDAVQASALSRRIGVVFAESLRPLELDVTVAMDHGVSTYPQDGDQSAQLIRISDERLYQSKHESHRKIEPAGEGTRGAASPAPAMPAEEARPPAPVAAETPVHQPAPEPAANAEPVEAEQTPAAPEPPPIENSPLQHPQPGFPLAAPEPHLYAVPRKAERVSMAGTNAYAVLGEGGAQRARVVDLGFGGVALDFPSGEGISETLFAVLHVPILPPVRVNLKRVWIKQLGEDTFRVGCCFIS
jgi:diguanylate cyclase (GGDEF)-like protein